MDKKRVVMQGQSYRYTSNGVYATNKPNREHVSVFPYVLIFIVLMGVFVYFMLQAA